MLRNKKRVRADSGEIIEHSVPLPQRPQPARPVEYIHFQPAPALPKSQIQETLGADNSDATKPGEDGKTRVGLMSIFIFVEVLTTCTESKTSRTIWRENGRHRSSSPESTCRLADRHSLLLSEGSSQLDSATQDAEGAHILGTACRDVYDPDGCLLAFWNATVDYWSVAQSDTIVIL